MKEKRAELETALADHAWVKGEDAASLRAVAAWRRAGSDLVALTVTDKAASDALAMVERALDLEVRARLAEIAAAHAWNRDVVRRARGDPPVDVPAFPDVAVDPDAVARWLVGHAGGYSLRVGRWRTEERLVGPGGPHVEARVFATPAGWDAVRDRAERWAAWARVEAEAAARPSDAAALRAAGLDALAGQGADWLVAEQRGSWSFASKDEGEGPLTVERQVARRAGARVEEATLELAAVRVFRTYRACGVAPSIKDVCAAMRAAGARGQDKALRDAYKAVADDPDAHGA